MSKKKESEKVSIHKKIHHKILHTKSKARITDKDVYMLSKEFFSLLLDIDYEFTHEELIDELRKTYMEKKDLEQAITFITRMGEMEFTSDEFTHQELQNMLDELHEILDHLAHEEEQLGWFDKLKKRFGRKEATKIMNEPTDKKEEEKLKETLEELKQSKEAKQTKELYQQAILNYELLTDQTKIKYYNKLLTIYHAIRISNEKEATKQKKETKKTKKKTATKKQTSSKKTKTEAKQKETKKTQNTKEEKTKKSKKTTLKKKSKN